MSFKSFTLAVVAALTVGLSTLSATAQDQERQELGPGSITLKEETRVLYCLNHALIQSLQNATAISNEKLFELVALYQKELFLGFKLCSFFSKGDTEATFTTFGYTKATTISAESDGEPFTIMFAERVLSEKLITVSLFVQHGQEDWNEFYEMAEHSAAIMK